jgi:hypothetical protein
MLCCYSYFFKCHYPKCMYAKCYGAIVVAVLANNAECRLCYFWSQNWVTHAGCRYAECYYTTISAPLMLPLLLWLIWMLLCLVFNCVHFAKYGTIAAASVAVVIIMLSVIIKSLMLSVIIKSLLLSVLIKSLVLCVITVSVIMLIIAAPLLLLVIWKLLCWVKACLMAWRHCCCLCCSCCHYAECYYAKRHQYCYAIAAAVVVVLVDVMLSVNYTECQNETARFKNCKELFEDQHLLLLRNIWWSKL